MIYQNRIHRFKQKWFDFEKWEYEQRGAVSVCPQYTVEDANKVFSMSDIEAENWWSDLKQKWDGFSPVYDMINAVEKVFALPETELPQTECPEQVFVLNRSEVWNSSITLTGNSNNTILVLKPTGEIIWHSPKGEVNVEDKKLLGVAFFDCVRQMTNLPYDFSLLDKDTYEAYQEFLNSAVEPENKKTPVEKLKAEIMKLERKKVYYDGGEEFIESSPHGRFFEVSEVLELLEKTDL